MAEEKSAFHEDPAQLQAATRDFHRAVRSLIEELDAIDWYAQRIEATADAELARELDHNRREEIEHASMLLEWLRRHEPTLAAELRRHLFTDAPIALDEQQEGDGERGDAKPFARDLGLGSLRDGRAGGSV